MCPIYEGHRDVRDDSQFVPGELAHLVAGNRGRLLDARRTPIRITATLPDKGAFELEVEAFEDAGARWKLPLEAVGEFQFSRDAVLAGRTLVDELASALARFDRRLVIECDPTTLEKSLRRLADERRMARDWLEYRGVGATEDVAACIGRREGRPELFAVLEDFLEDRGLSCMERCLSANLVTNPRSGELVKGHAIVLAELGLCPYRGPVIRDPELFDGPWSRSRRAEHLIARLAFTHELWSGLLGRQSVMLYRGAAVDGPLPPPSVESFVSATFSLEVAQDHFAGGPTTNVAVLWRQEAPVNRLLMTFIETAAMNRGFREAEAVLIAQPGNRAF